MHVVVRQSEWQLGGRCPCALLGLAETLAREALETEFHVARVSGGRIPHRKVSTLTSETLVTNLAEHAGHRYSEPATPLPGRLSISSRLARAIPCIESECSSRCTGRTLVTTHRCWALQSLAQPAQFPHRGTSPTQALEISVFASKLGGGESQGSPKSLLKLHRQTWKIRRVCPAAKRLGHLLGRGLAGAASDGDPRFLAPLSTGRSSPAGCKADPNVSSTRITGQPASIGLLVSARGDATKAAPASMRLR